MDFGASKSQEPYGWDNLEPTFTSRSRVEKEDIAPTALVSNMAVAVDYHLYPRLTISPQAYVDLT